MHTPASGKRRDWSYQLAAVAILVSSLAIVNANAEVGMNDDWSFISTVRQLAATGHLEYNAWSAPLIGFQAYWAALFVKIFGFSFLAVRASAWCLALFAIPVLWRLLRLVELSETQAFCGVVLFQLSPLVLPSLATFMTDMPAFWLFAAALLCGLKAWHTVDVKKQALWIVAMTGCDILSGSVRQIYWLAGACFLLALGIRRVRNRRGLALLVVCAACIFAFGAWASYWLTHQPFVPADTTLSGLRESSWREIGDAAGLDSLRSALSAGVLCLPLTLPLAWKKAMQMRWWKQIPILAVACIVPNRIANPLPWMGNTITNYGVILSGTVSLGEKPVILSDGLMWILASIGLACIIYSVFQIVGRPGPFATLTLPFLLTYTLVIAIRAPAFGLYDRYVIPHLFIVSVLVLRASAGISRMTWALGGIFLLYAICTTHDYYAEARAKLAATDEVLKAGYDRASIISGFEFDAWTQIEKTGHVNNILVKYPVDAYRDIDDCNGPDDVQAWWRSMAPALAARYVVTLTPLSGMQTTGFPSIEYRRWLPLGTYHVYVQSVGKNEAPLSCKAETGGA